MFHGTKEADDALEQWEKVHQQGRIPDSMPDVARGKTIDVVSSMRKCSRSEARRLIGSGAVRWLKDWDMVVDGVKVLDCEQELLFGVVKVGKKDFARIMQR